MLVVDDHPDAARLLAKLIRGEGYEVAEICDHHAAVTLLTAETHPVDAVVASFTTTGTRASLRLLDSLRTHPESTVNGLRVLLISDQPRQQIFSLQAGADAILARPYRSEELLEHLAAMLARPESERAPYRRERIDQLKNSVTHAFDSRGDGNAETNDANPMGRVG
ncbi:MAG: response regulator [Microthrixaceae bacterium]|nr:response regulator [Microthrixaceae bacterium]